MSESTNTESPKHVIEALELDIDLTKADLDFPQFPDGLYKVRIVGVQVQPNKAESGRNLIITGVNEETIRSTKGREFAAGKKDFKKYYPLQPSTKSPDWDWTQGIAKLQLAATGRREQGLRTPELASKVVYFKLKLDKEGRTGVDDVLSVQEVEEKAAKG